METNHQENKVLFDRLIPILFVSDLVAEKDFYISLGFTITYEGSEFPNFIAVGHGSIEFGIEHKKNFARENPDSVLIWQFGVKDIGTTKQLLTEIGVSFREEEVAPSEDWKYQVLHVRTPNGYSVMLEGPKD